jgi:hypothetical protein
LSIRLIISQQWCTLAILANNLATWEWFAASKNSWNTHGKREDEEQSTDDEGKDPLELENMWACQELANCSS